MSYPIAPSPNNRTIGSSGAAADNNANSNAIQAIIDVLGGAPQAEATTVEAAIEARRKIWNPTRFGAVGDGVTNDLPAFIACQDAMVAAGVSTMFVPTPDVSYFLDGSIPGGPNDLTYEGEDHSRGRGPLQSPDVHVLIGNGVDPIWDLVGTNAQNRSVTIRNLSAHNPGAPVIDADEAHSGHIHECLLRSTSLAGDLTGTVKIRRGPRWSITGKSDIICSGGAWALSARDDCNALTIDPSVKVTGGSAGGAVDVSGCQSVRVFPTVETSRFGHRVAAAGTDGGNCTDIRIGGYLENVEEPVSVGVSTDGAGDPVVGFTTSGFSFLGRIGNGSATVTPKFCLRLGRVRGWGVSESSLERKAGGTEPVVLFEYDAATPSYAQGGAMRRNFWSGGPGDTTDVVKVGATFPNTGFINRLVGSNELQTEMFGPATGIREWVSGLLDPSTTMGAAIGFVPAHPFGGLVESVDIIEASGTIGCTIRLGTPVNESELLSLDPSTLTLVNGSVRHAIAAAWWRASEGTPYPLLYRIVSGSGTGEFRIRVRYRSA